MLAALAASGLAPPSSRFGLTEALARASASASASISDASGAAASSAGGAGASRRRSLRLSAKQRVTGDSEDASAEPSEPAGSTTGATAESSSVRGVADLAEAESIASVAEPAPSETVVNDDEFAADFTDDEVDVDAEVRLISWRPTSLSDYGTRSSRTRILTIRFRTRPSMSLSERVRSHEVVDCLYLLMFLQMRGWKLRPQTALTSLHQAPLEVCLRAHQPLVHRRRRRHTLLPSRRSQATGTWSSRWMTTSCL